jgi:hypothetical protein
MKEWEQRSEMERKEGQGQRMNGGEACGKGP